MESNTEQPVETNPEQPMETQVENKPARKNRMPFYIALGVCAVILLAAAAFLAGRMMNQQVNSPVGPQMLVSSGGPAFSVGEGAGTISIEIHMVPAPELPQTQPEVNGLFTRRDDNSIYIGTFNEGMGIIASSGSSSLDDGSPSFETSGPAPSGPEVEVVVTADTKIYYDTTQIDPSGPPQGEIQQEVEEGSLDDLGSDSMVTVWGTRTGDRVVADVIFYTQPMIFMMPAVAP